MNALFLPLREENINPVECIPTTLPYDFPAGALLRIGPNPQNEVTGVESFLDGDGMLHSIVVPPPSSADNDERVCIYSNRYIDTVGRRVQKKAASEHGASGGGELPPFYGTLVAAPKSYPMLRNIFRNILKFGTLRGQKDTCNTAVKGFGKGKILCLMEQGLPSEVSVSQRGEINTIRSGSDLGGGLKNTNPLTGGNLGAHGRTCSITGERFQISYAGTPFSDPKCRIDVFSRGWKWERTMKVDVPVPVMIHDLAITENYAVVMDLPLSLRTERIAFDKFPVEFERGKQARIGLVPRKEEGGETIWFDCQPGVVLHMGTARETGDDGKTVILHGLMSLPKTPDSFILKYTSAYLYEWVLDLDTGKVTEGVINSQQLAEFPVVNGETDGRGADFIFSLSVSHIGGPLIYHNNPEEGVMFDGMVKFALAGENRGKVVSRFKLPANEFPVSEPTVVNEKYVVVLASRVAPDVSVEETTEKMKIESSCLYILETGNLSTPVARVELPRIVNYGLHSDWVDYEDLIW